MLEELKERVCKANIQLKESGLVILTWGNVSAIDRESNLIVIKPSGVSYDELTPDKMVVVNMEGKVVEGDLNPSSDTPTHIVLYQAFPELGGIVHTHSTYATVWAQAGLDIIAYGTTHADYFYGDVPCTMQMTADQISENYEKNTGYAITDTFARRRIGPMEIPACLVAQHGPFTWGETPEKAVENAVVLEEIAHMAVYNSNFQFGLTRITEELLDKHYLRKHGENAYYGQSFGEVTELDHKKDEVNADSDDYQIMPSEHTIELQNMSQINEVVPPVVHHKPPKKEEEVFKAADMAFSGNDDDGSLDDSFDIKPTEPDIPLDQLTAVDGDMMSDSFPDAWGEPVRTEDLIQEEINAANAAEAAAEPAPIDPDSLFFQEAEKPVIEPEPEGYKSSFFARNAGKKPPDEPEYSFPISDPVAPSEPEPPVDLQPAQGFTMSQPAPGFPTSQPAQGFTMSEPAPGFPTSQPEFGFPMSQPEPAPVPPAPAPEPVKEPDPPMPPLDFTF